MAPIIPNQAIRRSASYPAPLVTSNVRFALYALCAFTMNDGELDDLYQEVWAGFTASPITPQGTMLSSSDVPMTATLDSPMLPDEEYATFSSFTHGSLPSRSLSAATSGSSVTQSNASTYIAEPSSQAPSRALSTTSVSSTNSGVTVQSTGSTSTSGRAPRPLPRPPGATVSAPPAIPPPPPAPVQVLEPPPPPPLPPKHFSESDAYSTIAESMLSPTPEARLSPYPTELTSPATSQLEYWDSPIESEISYGRPASSQPSVRPPGAMAPVQRSSYPHPPDDVIDINGSNGRSSRSTYPTPNDDYSSNGYASPNGHAPPNGYHNSNGYASRGYRDTNAEAGPSTSRYTNGHQSNGYDTYAYHDDPRADPFFSFGESPANVAGPSNVSRSPTDLLQVISNYNENERERLDYREEEDEYWDEDEDDDETRFINFSLLSHVAVQFRDKVPRGTHVKGSIPYPRAFTGKDIVTTIQSQIQRDLAINHGISTNDRRAALQVARSLQSQLFFYEVEWGGRVLQDGVEDVYMFLDDLEGPSDTAPDREELPTAVITMLTKCYSPSCGEGVTCYSYSCPSRGNSIILQIPGPAEQPVGPQREAWIKTVPQEVIVSLPESEINRQTIIHKLISKEEQYLQDLDIVETVFIKGLRSANPPVIPGNKLEDFIDEVFGNILDLRECNRRLLEVVYVRQREHAPVIQRIGDIFLDAATEFRLAYPIYVGHHPLAEKRMKEELDVNPQFRLFVERCSRHRTGARMDLKHFLNRPSEHLQKYPVLLDAIYHETVVGNPDADFLLEAIAAIKNLQSVAQLRTFQTAMGKGIPGKWEWYDLVSADVRQQMRKEEAKRQSIIFELIKGEMAYVKDMENIEIMYIRPLRNADPPIVPTERLDQFIKDVFHNYSHIHAHHRALIEKLHEIQREQHPRIRSITEPLLDAALNFREAYLDYIPNYPIAAYRIDDEMANNPSFKAFVEISVRHQDAHRLDMKNFITRPIPRLLRYELLLKGILEETPADHSDQYTIPQLLEIIKSLGKESEPGVESAKQKVELWRYNSNIVFKPGESIDMDLLDENRSLIYAGKLLRQPESGRTWNELYVLLFDNYLVMTKPKEKDGVTRYNVVKRPIPLDLLTLVNFKDPPAQRSTGLLRNLRGRDAGGENGVSEGPTDSRNVFPCTIHHNARAGGSHILYAESAQARAEWQQKLQEALGLRHVVQESNKVFELEMLSTDTFLVPSLVTPATQPAYHENSLTGKVTCSVPFTTTDGRGLVAIGCAEGVWIGFRHDSRSMRRVLHLKMVTQCAMLEDFGIFLVLADKSLFAYHIEALVPSSPQSVHASQTPQKLNGNVQFFSVGSLLGRTLVIFMKRKNVESIFHVVEPIIDKINERAKAPAGIGSRFGFRQPKADWFRPYRDFFLPCESFDVMFLKARIVILCTKGFEIMDLLDFKSVTIPQREDPRLASLAKRCESCRPMGMFRSTDEEFLLCYNEFGLYVNKHGDPSPTRPLGVVEWEGNAERVAFHAPYVLLFDTRFIEVRDVETGRLAQIIPGNDMRCLWDGRGQAINSIDQNLADSRNGVLQDARVHGVMNAPRATTSAWTSASSRCRATRV
ncbi:hypothetical protein MSAN_00738200 [Mycena sanguinolenta]|uniref:Uncharacterized protein n=1 Tax=Mycena sanguinolenta TaxID=230812 RepID=A0A8H6Z1S5_9AGAR|nr:hypothetical protein MSAN_00738200 [Mycena sanguinolenta]